jgi:tetratricopeptide (TPR) repeat protein
MVDEADKKLFMERHLSTLRSQSRELRSLREITEDTVTNHDYSLTHPVGPLEISVDTDSLEEYIGGLAESIDNFSEAIEGELADLNVTATNIETAAFDAAESLHEIKGHTGQIERRVSYIADNIGDIKNLSAASLSLQAVGAALQYQAISRLDDISEGIEDLEYAISEGFGDLAEQMGDGFEFISEVLEEGFEHLAEGQVAIAKGISVQNKLTFAFGKMMGEGLQQISEGQNAIVRGINAQTKLTFALGKMMGEGLQQISEGQNAIYLQQQRDAAATQLGLGRIENAVIELNAAQNKRTEQVIDRLEHPNDIQAAEKFIHAFDQYRANNYYAALQDLREALAARSTHVPSLLLLGRISEERLDWKNAKDTYHLASKHALFQNDPNAYGRAIVALSSIEERVGNSDQSKEVLRGAKEKIKSLNPQIDRELFRHRVKDWINKGKSLEERTRIKRKATLLARDPDSWGEFISGKAYGPLRKEIPDIIYGPLISLEGYVSNHLFSNRINLVEMPDMDYKEGKKAWRIYVATTRDIFRVLSTMVDKEAGKEYRENSKLVAELKNVHRQYRSFERGIERIQSKNEKFSGEHAIQIHGEVSYLLREKLGYSMAKIATLAPKLTIQPWDQIWFLTPREKFEILDAA